MLVVRPLASEAELDDVYRMAYDVYRGMDYCSPCFGMRLIHYPELDRIGETLVLGAFVNGELVGTNSRTRDGPHGLHVDHDFKAEVDQVRAEKRFLGASWRIVTKPEYHSTRRVILALITETMHDMIRSGIETLLFTFNPQHESVYSRLLHARTIARRESIESLQNAPAVLMRLDWEDLPERWYPPLDIPSEPPFRLP